MLLIVGGVVLSRKEGFGGGGGHGGGGHGGGGHGGGGHGGGGHGGYHHGGWGHGGWGHGGRYYGGPYTSWSWWADPYYYVDWIDASINLDSDCDRSCLNIYKDCLEKGTSKKECSTHLGTCVGMC
jgi:hypothetical protein